MDDGSGAGAPGATGRQRQVPLVVTDFDGTLFELDMGHVLCDRYADPSWREINGRLHAGELSLPEAQRRMWALVKASLQQLTDTALSESRMRAGGEALFEAAAAGRCELIVASGGFDFYVEALLAERLQHLSAVYFNHLQVRDTVAVPEFPHAELACDRCAICKAQVIARHRGSETRRVIFCGDGFSDCCVAGACKADVLRGPPEIFAIEGRALHEHCIEGGIEHTLLTNFEQVVETL